ncbi:lanthionine synthetase LanC family protein [Taibaiella helva]|uniref:lanthionine synthetase LanC family protein n=1 Tax=Taibaiella helva TaxID=2301235 RepID=UPI000E576E33|nr:lanthionine synthetase LanC family protein [Taibaiella helva]
MITSLSNTKLARINEVLSLVPPLHHGFLGGSLGLLYYYYYAGEALQDEALYDKADALLEQVFAHLNDDKGSLSGYAFSDGAAGLGYVLSNLQQNGLLDFDIDTELTDIDRYIFDAALDHITKTKVDYLHGAMGALHYFSSRVQTPVINQYVNELTAAFCTAAISHDNGIYFLNSSLERLDNKKVDLGLAHGLPGFLLLLIDAWPNVKDKERLEQIIRAGIAFILSQEQPARAMQDEYSSFPCYLELDPHKSFRIDRLAWCYGDLNTVLLLYRAGKVLGTDAYTHIANRLGRQSVGRRDEEATLSKDTHFCHGSAGLAQFYKCLYQESENQIYLDAYRYWIAVTMELIDDEIEKGKYSANPVSILEGWPGVGLVLIEYMANRPMNWAKAFLL